MHLPCMLEGGPLVDLAHVDDGLITTKTKKVVYHVCFLFLKTIFYFEKQEEQKNNESTFGSCYFLF